MYILCIQRAELIPWRYDIFQPSGAFLFVRINNAASTRFLDNSIDKITGEVFSLLKNAYLRWAGSSFNSSLGVLSMEGLRGGPNTLFNGSYVSPVVATNYTAKNCTISYALSSS